MSVDNQPEKYMEVWCYTKLGANQTTTLMLRHVLANMDGHMHKHRNTFWVSPMPNVPWGKLFNQSNISLSWLNSVHKDNWF